MTYFTGSGAIFARQSKHYVLNIITHNPKYLDQFSMVLCETIITHNPKYLDQFLSFM